jgi:hypothetical protein
VFGCRCRLFEQFTGQEMSCRLGNRRFLHGLWPGLGEWVEFSVDQARRRVQTLPDVAFRVPERHFNDAVSVLLVVDNCRFQQPYMLWNKFTNLISIGVFYRVFN